MRRLADFWAKRTKVPGRTENEGLRHLQQQAFSLPLLDRRGTENRSDSFVKHCLESSLCESWALQVFDSTDLFRHGQPLRVGDGSQLLLLQLLNGVLIIPKIKLRPHEDDRSIGTVVSHFRIPLHVKKETRWSPSPLLSAILPSFMQLM